MTYFKNEYGDVYNDDNLADYIGDNVFDEDAFEEYLNDTEDNFEVCGYSYSAGETMRNAYPSDFDSEYRNKLTDLAAEFEDRLEGAELGESVEVYGDTYVTVCDEDGNTETVKTETISLAYSSFKVEGGEDKVLVFETEQEVENEEQVREVKKYKVEIPVTVFKEVAKQVLF